MSNKIRIILEGNFQCSPDAYCKYHRTVVIENQLIKNLLIEGYHIVGADEIKEIEEEEG